MGPIAQERHRPGALKQQNKSHKHGRHKSKGALDKIAKGKVAPKTFTKKASKELKREARRNKAAQIRHHKREEVVAQKRLIGSARTAPILVAIVALSKDADPYLALEKLRSSDNDSFVTFSEEFNLHLSVPRLKQRFCVILPRPGQLYATLDLLKVADSVLFLLSSAGEGIDDEGEELMCAAFAQGLPTPIIAATDIGDLPIKKRSEVKQTLQKLVTRWLPDEKLVSLDSQMDAQVLLRRMGGQKKRIVAHRDNRPHMLSEQVLYERGPEPGYGTLQVSGYIRGQPLSVNSLVHIPGWGDFQLTQMDSPDDPHPLLLGHSRRLNPSGSDETMEGSRILEHADPNVQESLVSENVPDPMDAEQTWPTAEELAEAARTENKKILKRVPKGTSEYQSAWIPDSEGEDEMSTDDEEEEDDDDGIPKAMSEEESCSEASDLEDMESVTPSEVVDSARYDKELDIDEEHRAFASLKDARLDAMFPDEIDTPQDVPARIRFQKYRGLKSFRTTPWDPREELPLDYARIFKFENFGRTRKKILNDDDRQGALPGWYVTLHIARVPEHLVDSRIPGHPLVVVGLLPHEQKMSVLNVVLKRYPSGYQLPIKSKQNLIFHLGSRRFQVAPIFSQHTNGDKHKYERYFQPESTVVATFFAPITFPPASALVFMEANDGKQHLVATGSLLSVDPDRVVVKRTVLSGHPFKVNKRSAVVRFMFFNREDINWFKPLELRTKYGRRGHIKEPLGTHGHMKCVFDGQMKSQDTVMLNLFKRIFPKWNYEGSIPDHKGPDFEVSEVQE